MVVQVSEFLYEGVSTRRLLDQIARQRGWDPATFAPAQDEMARMCQLANQALERAWRFAPWPQLVLTARVLYRPGWSDAAAPYPEGEQVYWQGGYWEATQDDASDEPADSSPQWRRCEREMVCGISYVRYGIDEIDLARGVYALDPDMREDARPLAAARTAWGAVVKKEPGRPFCARPYVRFRPLPPRLGSAPWSAEAEYARGDLVMGNDGESYEARVANQGVEPSLGAAASDDTWAPRRCPRMFESYVVQSAAAELATDDAGQAARRGQADRELQLLAEAHFRQINDPARAVTRVCR